MASRETITKRRDFLMNFLLARAGEDIPLTELNRQMQLELGTRDAQLTIAHLRRFLLKEVAPRLPAPPTIQGNVLRLDVPVDYVLKVRQRRRRDAKRALARVLWHLLLGAPLPAHLRILPSDGEEAEYGWSEMFKRKIARVRKAPVLSLYFDAGSTTLAAIQELEHFKTLAFAQAPAPRLQIVTNSLSIAHCLCESRHSIQTMLVGGQVKPEYESCSGLLAQQVLPFFAMANSVAILGATGYRSTAQRGGPSFSCQNIDEAFAKSGFHAIADLLSVVIMDASKLLQHDPSRIFATLESVNLVVVDSGEMESENRSLPAAVQGFVREAAGLGVAVAVATIPTEDAAEAES